MSKRRYTKFDQGILTAAHHLDWLGEDVLRNEVLGLNCLTVEDLRKEYPPETGAAPATTEGEPSPEPNLRQELERAVEETGGRFLSESETSGD